MRDLDDLLHDDLEETTLVIGHWTYAGTGWDTDGDAELAKAAAARARVRPRTSESQAGEAETREDWS